MPKKNFLILSVLISYCSVSPLLAYNKARHQEELTELLESFKTLDIALPRIPVPSESNEAPVEEEVVAEVVSEDQVKLQSSALQKEPAKENEDPLANKDPDSIFNSPSLFEFPDENKIEGEEEEEKPKKKKQVKSKVKVEASPQRPATWPAVKTKMKGE